MELTHRFSVPGTLEQTWERFGDIGSLAECFPGAQVTAVEGDTFEGTVKVKLGPIALVYAGSGTFVSKDEAAHSFVVEAKGRDKRGNGTAGATVTVAMSGSGDTTDVEVRTDLSITGKPAQFGRGVMQDVSDKLLGQFVACLEQRSGEQQPEQAAPEKTEAAATPAPSVGPAEPTVTAPAPEAAGGGQQPGLRSAPMPAAGDDALDLGATVLPVLLRSYWRQVAAGGAALALLVWLLRRRRH